MSGIDIAPSGMALFGEGELEFAVARGMELTWIFIRKKYLAGQPVCRSLDASRSAM
jgi:hypothetical protein